MNKVLKSIVPGLLLSTASGFADAGCFAPAVPEISTGFAPLAIAIVVGIAVVYKEFTGRK